jgi:ataxin-3
VQGSGNVDPSGNFSIQVLRAALTNAFGLSLPNIRQQGALGSHDVTDVDGFICNKDSHWFAIRKINGRYWNLNSMQERPEIISHFRLAAEIQALQDSGYSVFMVPPSEELPPECRASAMRERGLPQYWWREEDLVKGKSDAITGATDPWRNVGSGMRLDGKSSASGVSTGTKSNVSSGNAAVDVASMTEEEMLQMAMMASLETAAGEVGDDNENSAIATDEDVSVPPEPEVSDKDAVRIQFRLPGGASNRVVRRFRKTDKVGGVYSFVKERSPSSSNGKLELRAGFPPVDLSSKRSQTIDEANLSGESIQCRYV